MRLLFDQSFDRRLLQPLRDAGHDVTVVAIDYPPGISDRDVLAIAEREQRILLTFDRDFGELAIHEQTPHAGIIYLRTRPTTVAYKLARLNEVFATYTDQLDCFLTVTESAVRVQ